MAMWMPYQSFDRRHLVLMLVLPLVCGGKLPYCHPPGKQMLQDGVCVDCPRCVPGQFFNKTKEITVDRVFGSLECYPCQDCPAGKYSSDRKWDEFNGYICYTHKDCGKRGRVVETPGTNRTNTVCGDCRKGYVSEDWPIVDKNSYCFPCSAKDKNKPECRGFITSPTNTAHVNPGDPFALNPGDHVIAGHGDPSDPGDVVDHSDPVPSGLVPPLAVTVASCGVLLAVFFIIVYIYKYIQQQGSEDGQQENLETKTGLLAGHDVEYDGPKVFSSITTGVSVATMATTSTTSDVSTDMELLTEEEERIASSTRLQNDDRYVRAVGNADTNLRRQNDMRSLMFTLELQQVQIDEIADEHPISYLNKFIQCKGKEATLLKLYNALKRHRLRAELDALITELRKKF